MIWIASDVKRVRSTANNIDIFYYVVPYYRPIPTIWPLVIVEIDFNDLTVGSETVKLNIFHFFNFFVTCLPTRPTLMFLM